VEGYIINLAQPSAEFVIGAYPRLFQIEKSFRVSKHDLAARPIYHHKRASIEAHLTIVFARSRFPGSSRTAPAGRPASSCRPPAVTAPSRSTPPGTS
jgi:hypothetical protein